MLARLLNKPRHLFASYKSVLLLWCYPSVVYATLQLCYLEKFHFTVYKIFLLGAPHSCFGFFCQNFILGNLGSSGSQMQIFQSCSPPAYFQKVLFPKTFCMKGQEEWREGKMPAEYYLLLHILVFSDCQ